MTHTRPARLLTTFACAVAALTVIPAAGRADTITSKNWSGYAAHKRGVAFRHVTATWVEPAARCTAGTNTYSAFWVGIGGYSLSSKAMEQLGTELDCNSDGTASLSAWYELLPAPSRAIRMTVNYGDVITANISLAGQQVNLNLQDLTRHESFNRTFTPRRVDASSAEWIAEAPSDCSTGKCVTLPLTDFGVALFGRASATTTTGRTGAISSSMWNTTKLLLGYSSQGSAFVAKTTTANAAPSALTQGGSAFAVGYGAPGGGIG